MMRLLRRSAPRNDTRGFSLMELTIMIAIGAVLFTGLSRAVQTLMETAIENRNYMIALNLAKWQMAISNNAAYPAVAAEAAQTADTAFPNFIPTKQVVSVATSGGNSIRIITIRVRLGSSTGPVLVRLDTYRSNIITFGNGT